MSILLPVTKQFNDNKLPPVKSWTGINTSVVDNSLVIGNNGNANVSLSLSGLNSSSFRLLRIVFDATLPEMSNLSNSSALEFIIKYRYLRNVEAGSNEVVSVYNYLYQSLVLTPLNCTTEGGHLVCEKIVACPELDSVSIECSIYNRTGASATIISCTLKQSYDTQPSQLTEQIDWSMGIERFDIYDDGLLVTFRNDSEPLELQWQENEQHEWNGILVNGTLNIPVQRHSDNL
jgi:hypothetical protein